MFSIILATDQKMGIGKNNGLPWNEPMDLKNFKRLTENNIVIMGRKTWNSIGKKPLKNRINIVISTTLKTDDDNNVLILPNLECLFELRENGKWKDKKWFIIGGTTLYDYFLSSDENIYDIYWTLFNHYYDCDVFLKNSIDIKKWKNISINRHLIPNAVFYHLSKRLND